MKRKSCRRRPQKILIGLLLLLFSSACSSNQPLLTAAPPTDSADDATTAAPPQESEAAETTAPVTPSPVSTTNPTTGWKIYENDTFGLSFGIPPAWHGPDVYEWEGGLRLAVGSDVVYPYGTDRTEQVYQVKNSYYVTIQYRLNRDNLDLEQFRANQPWTDTYFSLLDLNDGQSISSPRSLVIRQRQIKLDGFEGLEYLSTLPEAAQTERVYAREVMLFDEGLNTLTITGSPNNVEVTDPDNWRETYQQVDAANLDTFYEILQSISFD